MRIATWNVNSIRSRLDHVASWLSLQQPEVLCLQETKVTDDLFPYESFKALGYEARVSGQPAYNGVAILSRLPIENVRVGFEALLSEDSEATRLGEQKRIISAQIEGIWILNLYVPNGSSLKSEKYSYKLEWLSCLGRYLEVQAGQGDPLAILGDFNIALEARDIHDPGRLEGGIMASQAERQTLRSALGHQMADVFRVFEPEAGHWSWWDYRSGAWDRDRGWRIDHIYLNEQLTACATGCVIHRDQRGLEQPSDHAPVEVKLVWPPAGEESY